MRCPYCDHVLADQWLKKVGASLMGKTTGERKARSYEVTSAAANKRWEQARKKAPAKKKKKIPT